MLNSLQCVNILRMTVQLKKSYPLQFQDVLFPSKRMIGRFNPEFVERRRMALQKFLEQTMEHPEIINSSSELRAFVEIDKNVCSALSADCPTMGVNGSDRVGGRCVM